MIAFIIAHALYKAALFFCAGTTIHAVGEGRLSLIGGLARRLPVTTLAAGMAAISMAGLPPTLGFITKEYLFESQLNASFGWVVVAVAVLVNARRSPGWQRFGPITWARRAARCTIRRPQACTSAHWCSAAWVFCSAWRRISCSPD